MRSMSMWIKGKERYDRIQKLSVLPVTRRTLKRPFVKGEYFKSVNKGMGLKKGEHAEVWGTCVIVSVTNEPLNAIIKHPYRDGSTISECEREGFGELSPEEFVAMVIKAHSGKRVTEESIVQRYEFREVNGGIKNG